MQLNIKKKLGFICKTFNIDLTYYSRNCIKQICIHGINFERILT